jgi:hypothetical protein
MKPFLTMAVAVMMLVVGGGAFAAVPQTINYQGYMKNGSGAPVNTQVSVTFSLYSSNPARNNPVWRETQSVTPANGVYSVQLGAVAPLALPFDVVYFLGVQVGSDPEMVPLQPLASAPYAFRAGTAESATTAVSATTVANGAVTDDQISGPISAAKLDLSTVVSKSGSTMTGPLNLPTDGLAVGATELVTSGGRVGIGTATPNEQLEITGNLRLPITTAATGIIRAGTYTLIHTYGTGNFSAGLNALNLYTSGYQNTATGALALCNNTTGTYNTASGFNALTTNTTGSANTAIGRYVLYATNTGSYNTASGAETLYSNTTGSNNTASGYSALYSNTTAHYNTADGYKALISTTGAGNTAVGANAGVTANSANANTTGSNNTFIGYNSGPGTPTQLTNATAIGANALVSASNSLVLGGTGAYAVKVGIGTTSPTEALDVGGNIRIDDNNLWFRAGIDTAHGLGFYGGTKLFGTNNPDGPVLFGSSGGALGTTGWGKGQQAVLKWDYNGNVTVLGALSKGSGSFKIDHPLDPHNKYLYHSFVESPDMMNIYNGNVTTDGQGYATVELPAWFEALNKDFRYQLTVIGSGDAWARARISKEIETSRFVIQTDLPETKVSWQVTGIRKDAYANAHRIPVEEEKPAGEKGTCLHPEACGQ